jgi:hypothetical protein
MAGSTRRPPAPCGLPAPVPRRVGLGMCRVGRSLVQSARGSVVASCWRRSAEQATINIALPPP